MKKLYMLMVLLLLITSVTMASALSEIDETAFHQILSAEDNPDEEIVKYPSSPVEFDHVMTDYGFDMDGDELYDYLVMDLSARTSEPGMYYLNAELYLPMGTTHGDDDKTAIGFQVIEMTPTTIYLNETFRKVSFNFEGGRIQSNQLDGPYEVGIGIKGFGHVLDYTTDEYNYTQFEQPNVLLSGPVRSKDDAIELAREKAAEIRIYVGEVKGSEILVEEGHNVWAFTFEGESFDEKFVIHGNSISDVEHWTVKGESMSSWNLLNDITGVLLALFLGVVLLMLNRTSKHEDTKYNKIKYILFLFIGILSFYLSGYVLRGIHPPTNILYGLLIFILLFIIGLAINRDLSAMFVIKTFTISFGVLFLIFAGFFAWGAYSHYDSKYIDTNKLETVPDEFVVLTEEELKEYPALKKAVETESSVKASPGEWKRTFDLINEKGSHVIKFGDGYYRVGFVTA